MPVPHDAVRRQVRKLLASDQLARSDGLAKLLRYVVEETLRGRAAELKETRIGVAVLGRPADTYDAAIDPIVRVQMGRLRARLRDYYAGVGATDPVRIELHPGSYVPTFRSTTGPHEPAPSPTAAALRLAVLPFVNMSDGDVGDAFSDGLTEELINVLARDPQLQVVARTSTFQFKQQARDIRDIGRHLGVGKILEGSVRQSGTRVRITVHLINAVNGCHLWSERYEREVADLFAVHDEIAAAIHDALRGCVAPAAAAPSPR